MKNIRKKKGFTIVELVIVIAVIGVLSAILIPTFSNLVSKAQNASDEALVKNLNTSLKIEEVDEGKNNTFQEVLDDLAKHSYSIANLRNLNNGNTLLWNSDTNQFLLERNLNKESNKDQKYRFWKIQDSIDENQQYSVYASPDFEDVESVSVNVGFDVGNNTNIKMVKYIRNDVAQNVSIRTNGGMLVVRAPNDTVRHYGMSEASIVSRDSTSYIENGISHNLIDPTLTYGNRFAQTASSRLPTNHTRAALDTNLYLKEGTTIKLLDTQYVFGACRTVKDNVEGNEQQTVNPAPRDPDEHEYMTPGTSDYVTRESTYHGIAFYLSNSATMNLDNILFEDLFAISYHEPGSDPFGDDVIDGMNTILRRYNKMFPNGVVISTASGNYQVYHGYLRTFTGTISNFNESTVLQNEYNKITIYHDGGFAQLKQSLNALEAHSDVYKYSSNNHSVVFVGDSITFGTNTTKTYYQYLYEHIDISSYIAISSVGSCVSDQSSYGDDRNPLIDNYQAIPAGDVVMIYLGTNDYGRETPLGTSSDTTSDTFYGSLDVIMSGLKSRLTRSKVIFLTPTRRYKEYTSAANPSYHFTSYTVPNGIGFTLENYVDAIKEMATKYSFDVIDLFTEWDINPASSSVRSTYMNDGLHPNADGHRVIEDIIYNDLLTLDIDYRGDVAKEMRYGNKFAEGALNQTGTTRICLIKNRYFEAGTTITLNDNTTYRMGVAKTSGENTSNNNGWLNGGWTTNPVTIATSGWYGISFDKGQNGPAFNIRTESVGLDDMVTIVEP